MVQFATCIEHLCGVVFWEGPCILKLPINTLKAEVVRDVPWPQQTEKVPTGPDIGTPDIGTPRM
jgi:hypothetical protein